MKNKLYLPSIFIYNRNAFIICKIIQIIISVNIYILSDKCYLTL